MKIQIPKKLRVEDFDSEDQPMIEKIGFIYNSFTEETFRALNNGIDYDNLRRQIVPIQVTIDSTGTLINGPQIKQTIIGKPIGILILNATNINEPGVYPVSAPFVSWNINSNGIITILNVTGLQNSSQYLLTAEIIV